MRFPNPSNGPISFVVSGCLRLVGFILILSWLSCNQQNSDVQHPTPLPEVKDTGKAANVPQKDAPKDTAMQVSTPLASPPSSDAQVVEEAPGFVVNTIYDSAQLWGYEIYFGKKLLIRQKNIPSLPGTKGFATKEQAKRTGNFVAWKASNNIFPPTVNKQELDSLGVLNDN